MRPNFDISLPSIPGKTIKFKIQDIKQTSFGSKKQRFNENKRGLTKKFIESFNNFHQNKDLSRIEQETQASQTNSRISSKSTFEREKNQISFRHIVPQDRKHIVSLYEKFKNYQAPILKQSKFQKGFTFNRAEKKEELTQKIQVPFQSDKLSRKFVTDNYYFTSTVMQTPLLENNNLKGIKNNIDKAEKKLQKPSAVFKNETRQKVWDRSLKNQVPGPGFYEQKNIQKSQRSRKKAVSMKQTKGPQNDYKKLKQIITSIVGQEKQQEDQNQALEEDNKKQKMQYMFVKDDRDRFGSQKYPIATRLNVPGPGSYEIMQGIQDQARKITLVQQQRKLLKQWFNN